MFWSPLGRDSVVVRSENAPALLFVVPDASDGLNGSVPVDWFPARVRAGAAVRTGRDVEFRCGRDGRVARPRRERRERLIARFARTTTEGGRRQWRAFAAEEFQFELFERELAGCFRTSSSAAPSG